jgi:hypothetical protein
LFSLEVEFLVLGFTITWVVERLKKSRAMMKLLWVCILVALGFSKRVDGFVQYSHRGDPKTEIINNTLMVSITLIRGADPKAGI